MGYYAARGLYSARGSCTQAGGRSVAPVARAVKVLLLSRLLHFLSQVEKVLAGCRRIRVLRAQHFLLDSQGLLEEGFCLRIPSLITIEAAQGSLGLVRAGRCGAQQRLADPKSWL